MSPRRDAEREALGHPDQDAVAGLVAQRVVDRLEVVEVGEHDSDLAVAPVEGRQGLGEAVHQRQAVRQAREGVVEGLVGEGLLGDDLCGHVPGDAESPDHLAVVVPERQLGRRDPSVGPVVEGLALDLRHHRLAGADDPLLVVVGGPGVLVAEEVEVGLAEHLADVAPLAWSTRKLWLTRRNLLSRSLKNTRSPGVPSRLSMHNAFRSARPRSLFGRRGRATPAPCLVGSPRPYRPSGPGHEVYEPELGT